MRKFEIKPHIGIGPIELGMDRDQVHSQLGTPDSAHGNRERFLNGFMVDFDGEGTVEFIELARSDLFQAEFDGLDLHRVLAETAIQHVSRFARYDEENPELRYTFIFPELQLSLWRGTIPEPDQPPDDPDGRHFEAVGVAVDSYFESANA